MQDMSNTVETIDSTLEPSSERETPVVLRAPRGAIWEWLLVFSTLGIYSSFWFYHRAKELRQVTSSRFTPVLWFFVPFVAIFQIIAYFKLDKAIRELEKDTPSVYQLRRNFSVGAAGFVSITIYFSVTSDWAVPGWIDALAYLSMTLFFALMTTRVNQVKRDLTDVSFKGKRKGFTVWEWVLVVVMFPLVIAIFSYAALSPYFIDKVETYPDNYYYKTSNEDLSLQLRGEGWYRLQNGSYSDGSAIAEFGNDMPESYFLLFENNNLTDDQINEHMDSRRSWIRENMSKADCKEKRGFRPRTMDLKIELVCNGKTMLEPASTFITYIQIDDSDYELLGVLTGPENSYQNWLVEYREMAREFGR